jgi:putative spermidine/putrescine transport system permease protein
VRGSDLKLVLPLAVVFAVFFVAPLLVLVAMSLSSDAELHAPTLAHYTRFFTDSFNYSILWATIALGV